MLTDTQTDLIRAWIDPASPAPTLALFPSFTGRYLLPDGTLTDDSRVLIVRPDAYHKFQWHDRANCFLFALSEDGSVDTFVPTTNPPTFDVSAGYKAPKPFRPARHPDQPPPSIEVVPEVPVVAAAPVAPTTETVGAGSPDVTPAAGTSDPTPIVAPPEVTPPVQSDTSAQSSVGPVTAAVPAAEPAPVAPVVPVADGGDPVPTAAEPSSETSSPTFPVNPT